jgi:TolB-like protein
VKNIVQPIKVSGRARSRPPPGRRLFATIADKPSIAVLPFTNMSADPEQEFFADGIAEDVITALSRYHYSLSPAIPASPTGRAVV